MVSYPDASLWRRAFPSVTSLSSAVYYRRRSWIAVFVVCGLMIGIMLLINHQVDRALRQVIMDQLRAARESNANSLTLWLHEQKQIAASIAQDSGFVSAVEDLTDAATAESVKYQELLNHPATAVITSRINDRIGNSILGWVICSDQGTVLSASEPSLVARKDFQLWHAVDSPYDEDAKTAIIAPFPAPLEIGDQISPGMPILASVATIQGHEQAMLANLLLLLNPADGFTRVLEVARSGSSGETYAIGRGAKLLSRSRFEEQLRAQHQLSTDENSTSILAIEIREPIKPANQTEHSNEFDASSGPLTKMAQDLMRRGVGESSVPYLDYRGVSVVGAWRWIEGYDFGIATEIDESEIYRPLKLLQSWLWSLSGILCLSMASIVFLVWTAERSRHQTLRESAEGQKMGQYELIKRIGTGGMGNVYIGRHALLRRPVAIKVLQNRSTKEPRALARFEREVQLTSRLTSPNTVAIYDYGQTDAGEFFYVMEYLEGLDLADLVNRFGPLPANRVIHILRQVCASLSEAHALGCIHRDVKPANIILTMRGGLYDFIKLVDFGLVKRDEANEHLLTRTGAMAGTPMYMSPEAVRHPKTMDGRSDLYSLGAVGYWLIAGAPLFSAGTPVEVCARQVHEAPIPPSALGRVVPADLEEVILACLSKDPAQRPESADALDALLLACANAGTWTQANARAWWDEAYLPNRTINHVLAHDQTYASVYQTRPATHLFTQDEVENFSR